MGRAETQHYKLYVDQPGAYRVDFEDLAIDRAAVATTGLGLSVGEVAVPLWVEDHGDGEFGPGDWFEFLGSAPLSERTQPSELNRFNVYRLQLDAAAPARMVPGEVVEASTAARATLRAKVRLEEDRVRVRFRSTDGPAEEEIWYWERIAHGQRRPFEHTIELPDLDGRPDRKWGATLRMQLRGWSKPRKKPTEATPDHRVEIKLNGTEVAVAEWNGQELYDVDVTSLPRTALRRGPNRLSIEIPTRSAGASDHALVDVVLLNWIEIDYPRDARVRPGQSRFRRVGEDPVDDLRLTIDGADASIVYGDRGSRWLRTAEAERPRDRLRPQEQERTFATTSPDALLRPVSIAVDHPSTLVHTDQQADYIMIAHARLIDAVAPLAKFHRDRGLAVAVVDVEDVYDEFNHGVASPRAIRDFLAHAYHAWRRPAPRFVLLVGDASWDAQNDEVVDANYADSTFRPTERRRFAKNRSTAYGNGDSTNYRGLIPTWNYGTYQGPAASDNYFVSVDGEDALPDLAIGRLPVVEPAEVTAIVDKTIRFISTAHAGAQPRKALFITNEQRGLQRRSDGLADRLATEGFSAQRVYPDSSEASNEEHSRRLLELFDAGQAVVHFLGHGGRYIWRTGPPDLEKNHDLFTLEHLDELSATDQLPIVLSMTCFSAPFDHPNADSIGEKLLRLPDRGAIAVLAASWRNSPSVKWSEAIFDELARPETTVGEAIQRAKREIAAPMFVETYNLLGDPAAPIPWVAREAGQPRRRAVVRT